MSRRKGKKKPKTAVNLRAGGGGKTPKAAGSPGPVAGEDHPTYSFRYADRNHDGGWSWPAADEAAEILRFLCDLGSNTWGQIKAQETGGQRRHKKHHYQPLDSVSANAQRRLFELRHDETFDELFRFRLSGTKRLWGFLVGGVFYVLWWDANHQVCPVEPN